MRKSLTTWLGILGGAGLCLAAQAVRPDPSREQYRDIPERNVFGLKTDQSAAEPTAPKGPPPKLTLTGITTLLGNKLALLRAALPAAPGVPAQEKPLMLSEGQRDGNIEVLEINEQQRSVRVNDAGEVVVLTFAKNGVQPSAVPATAAGTPPSNAPALLPGFNPRMRVLPTRTPRTPMAGAAPETGAAAAATNAAVAAAAAAVAPTTPTAADTALSPTGRVPTENPPTNQSQLSPEAQVVLQVLQQQQQQQQQEQQQQEQQQPGANYDNANPAPLPPALSAGPPFPAMPPGSNLQRARPPFFPQ